MAYTNETTHYGLPLPTGSDLTVPMDYNESFEEIDTVIFEAQTNASGAVGTAGNALDVANAASTAAAEATSAAAGATATAQAAATAANEAVAAVAEAKDDALDMICAVVEETATAQYKHEPTKGGLNYYFRYNDILYKTTAVINVGETIVPNTNCAATNVATELEAGSASGLSDVTLATETADGVKTLATMLNSFNSYLSAMSDNELSHSFIIVKGVNTSEYNRYEFRMRNANNACEFINYSYDIDATYINDIIREFSIAQTSTAFEIQNVYVRASGEFSLARVTELDTATPSGNVYELHTLK